MGVFGLWQILNSTARPITLDSLENQTIAVDVSIWMHQAVRGVRERRGITVTDSHLLVMFHRICKLLHYRIKPIFVFDGPAPALKQRLLERRRRLRSSAEQNVNKLSVKLMENLLRQQAVGAALDRRNGRKPKSPVKDSGAFPASAASTSNDIFALPAEDDAEEEELADGSSDSDEDIGISASNGINFDKVDINSADFKALTPEIRHEILLEMQAQRKRPSWKMVGQLPQDSEEFSNFQIERLMKKRMVQRSIDQNAKEMNSRRTGAVLEELRGKVNAADVMELDARRIASTDSSHYVLFKRRASQESQSEVEEFDAEAYLIANGELPPDDEHISDCQTLPTELELSSAVTTELSSTVDVEAVIKPLTSSFTSDCSGNAGASIPSIPFDPTRSRILQNLQKLAAQAKSSPAVAMPAIKVPESPMDSDAGDFHGVLLTFPEFALPSSAGENGAATDSSTGCDSEIVEEVHAHQPNQKVNWESSDSDGDFEEVPDLIEIASSPEVDKSTVDTTKESAMPVITVDLVVLTETQHDVTTQDNTGESPTEVKVSDSSATIDTSWEEDDDIFPFMNLEDERPPDSQEDSQDSQELSVEELESLQTHLQTEGRDVLAERQKEERVATSVTEQLRMECQELLQLFGIPFLNSPGEAEAQCAYMDLSNQVNGTITDDSDIWLFGGKKVYKNVFNKKRYVEAFSAEDIQSQLGLTQDKIISFGLLTGSDYTEGIDGVGGIRALEIMAEFGGDGVQSLHRFRKWYDQSQQRRRQGDLRPESKLRAQLADLHVPEIFPDNLVVQAYREPDVDRSTEKFTWGLPALDLLREYCRRKFGWKQQKSDEILLPIIKRLNARDTQTHLESFFRVQLERTGSGLVGSRRLGAAIQKIKSGEREAEGGGMSEEEDECGAGAVSQTKRKRVNCTDAGKPTMPSGSEMVRSKRKKTAAKQPSGPEAVSVATVKRKRPQRLRKTCEPVEVAQHQDSVESNEM